MAVEAYDGPIGRSRFMKGPVARPRAVSGGVRAIRAAGPLLCERTFAGRADRRRPVRTTKRGYGPKPVERGFYSDLYRKGARPEPAEGERPCGLDAGGPGTSELASLPGLPCRICRSKGRKRGVERVPGQAKRRPRPTPPARHSARVVWALAGWDDDAPAHRGLRRIALPAACPEPNRGLRGRRPHFTCSSLPGSRPDRRGRTQA